MTQQAPEIRGDSKLRAIESTIRSRFKGALVGAAAGDAIGAHFEGWESVPLAAIREVLDGERPLRYTDDTHMTIGVAESLIEQRGFEGAHMAEMFARNFEAEPWRGYGPGPPQVFNMIRQGVRWDEAGARLFGGSGSYGNGAAMRVAPIGLFAHRDIAEMVRLARQSARITHAHEFGIAGAVLQASAVAFLAGRPDSGPIQPAPFLDQLRDVVELPEYVEKLNSVGELLRAANGARAVQMLGNGIAAHESVPTAIFVFLNNASSIQDAVTAAIELGGDTDTIASMTGALAGAHLGLSAIPDRWLRRVEGVQRLIEIADQLFSISARKGPGTKGF